MRAPDGADIAAPEFPPGLDWLNVAFLRMQGEAGRHAVLIEFFDTARINSVRTRPYMDAWHERYAGAGLCVIGVHSPGYSFGRERAVVERAVGALGIQHPVVLDPDLEVWRLYGNRGWPGRYLFGHDARLRYIHYGEGDYQEAERAIAEALGELDPSFEAPDPLPPVRPEDAQGALLEPQTADIALPRERDRLELVRDWTDGEDFIEAADAGAAATVTFTGGGGWAVLSGGGLEPGLYETDGTVVAEEPGLCLHGFQFTPRPPDPSGEGFTQPAQRT